MLKDIIAHKDLAKLIADEDFAREFIEFLRWPNGVTCPRCEATKVYKIAANPEKKVRKGLYKCAGCKKQFTVTVGTIFEDSHVPLNKWIHAIHLLCSSKKGFSAHQLHRTLGIRYPSAWHLMHRVRYVSEFDFRFNRRKMTDGERMIEALRKVEGKRLMYKSPAKTKKDETA